jgi:hypothetical protein
VEPCSKAGTVNVKPYSLGEQDSDIRARGESGRKKEPKGEKQGSREHRVRIFEESVVGNYLTLTKSIKPQLQEFRQSPIKRSTKKSSLQHLLIRTIKKERKKSNFASLERLPHSAVREASVEFAFSPQLKAIKNTKQPL